MDFSKAKPEALALWINDGSSLIILLKVRSVGAVGLAEDLTRDRAA
jgi:hypothetical protein